MFSSIKVALSLLLFRLRLCLIRLLRFFLLLLLLLPPATLSGNVVRWCSIIHTGRRLLSDRRRSVRSFLPFCCTELAIEVLIF